MSYMVQAKLGDLNLKIKGSWVEECIQIVDDISNITKWIIDGLYPKQICEKLGFC